MLAILQEKARLLCDVCFFEVKLSRGEVIASERQIPGHVPQALTVCGESCAIIGEHRLEVKPVNKMPLRTVLEGLLRE